MKGNKLRIIIILSIILLIGFFYYFVTNNQKSSVLSENTLVTTGYNGYGTADIQNETKQKIIKIQLKKAGYTNSEIKYIQNSNSSDSVGYGTDKFAKFANWTKETKVTISKNKNIKNGDKITVQVSTAHDKTNPIKEQKKTFKINNLTLQKVKSINTLKNKFNIYVEGLENHGIAFVKFDDNYYDTTSTPYNSLIKFNDFNIKNSGHIKNGDTVTATIPAQSQYTEKINYKGSPEKSTKAEHLYSPSDIDNIDDIIDDSNSIYSTKYDHTYLYATHDISDYGDETMFALVQFNDDSSSKDTSIAFLSNQENVIVLIPKDGKLVKKTTHFIFDHIPEINDVKKNGIKIK